MNIKHSCMFHHAKVKPRKWQVRLNIPSVETKPSHPEENSSNDNVRNVMWAIIQFMSAMSTTFAQHDTVCESSTTGRDMDRSSTSEVETTHVENPTGSVPCPASNWIIDNG